MIDVYCLRGTTEAPGPNGQVGGLLTEVTKHLDPRRFRCIDVDYPAAIGPANPRFDVRGGVSMAGSIEAGVEALGDAVRGGTGPYGLLGYSLGAMVVSRFLEVGAFRPTFVGLIANPLRAEGDSLDGRARGWGIAGQRGEWPNVPVFEVANPADVITACPPDSPLRYLSDVLTYAAATDLQLWRADVLDRVRTGRWQAGMARPSLGSYGRAVTDLGAYLFGGAHIGAYTSGPNPMTRQLAERISGIAGTDRVVA